jgi:hypothetical protein
MFEPRIGLRRLQDNVASAWFLEMLHGRAFRSGTAFSTGPAFAVQNRAIFSAWLGEGRSSG